MHHPHSTTSSWLRLSLLALTIAACAAPHRDYDLAKIRRTTDLVELMDVQATVADPLFESLGTWRENGVPDSAWGRLQDAANRLQATAVQVARLPRVATFLEHNETMRRNAVALAEASAQRQDAAAVAALAAIRGNCRACHRAFR